MGKAGQATARRWAFHSAWFVSFGTGWQISMVQCGICHEDPLPGGEIGELDCCFHRYDQSGPSCPGNVGLTAVPVLPMCILIECIHIRTRRSFAWDLSCPCLNTIAAIPHGCHCKTGRVPLILLQVLLPMHLSVGQVGDHLPL